MRSHIGVCAAEIRYIDKKMGRLARNCTVLQITYLSL